MGRGEEREQPLKDVHLRSKYQYELEGNGNFSYLNYLGAAALFLLVIAWINYISLTSARAIDRSKEVGVRKVIGAARSQLIRQFLLSSFLAGAYPSFVLSAQAPLQALKPVAAGMDHRGNRGLLRRSLVVLQFFAAIVLISGALGLNRQLQYMSRADLGLIVRQTLILHQSVRQDSSKAQLVASFIHDLESHPGIESVTASTSVPGSEVGGSSRFTTLHSDAEKTCRDFGIDSKFIPDYGLTVTAGRNFITDKTEPETNVILNEAAVRVFGFRNDAVIVAGLGLLGLSLYTVARRRKEISIRKVLGASVFHIVRLITRDFLRLVLLSALGARPPG